MKKLLQILIYLLAIIFITSCEIKNENLISKIPNVSDIPEITKETKENVTGLKTLSENYVIKNIKKANKYLEETNRNLMLTEKKDKKKALKEFVQNYKEIVEFYVDVTKEQNVIKIKQELMGYYDETVLFCDSLAKMEEDLKIFKEDCLAQIKVCEKETSKESAVKKARLEAEYKNAERQEKMISDFKNNYQRLIPEMKKVQSDVDFFIFTLQETAKVYESAYRTVELSMNISNAIDNIQELTSLDELTNEVMTSWENLDGILDSLTDISDFLEY